MMPPPTAVITPSVTTPTMSRRAVRTAVSAPFRPNTKVPIRSSTSSSGDWVAISPSGQTGAGEVGIIRSHRDAGRRPTRPSARPGYRTDVPRALVTNDDGIDSPGLWALAAAAHAADLDVVVAAPHRGCSGVGTSVLSVRDDSRTALHPRVLPGMADIEAWAV